MKIVSKAPKQKRRKGQAVPLRESDINTTGANQLAIHNVSKYSKARKANYTKPKRRKK